MKLVEVVDIDQSSQDNENISVGEVYEIEPTTVETNDNKQFRVFTFDKVTEEGNVKSDYYTLISPDQPIHVKVLSFGHPENNDPQLIRARVISDPETQLAKFDLEKHEHVQDDSGGRVVKPLKKLDGLNNLDAWSDSEFFKTFGRRRMEEDHGLVGYFYNRNQFEQISQDDENDDKHPTGKDKQASFGKGFAEPEDDSNKLEQAIAIYKASKHLPRKEVIKRMQQQLQMTKAGASSYYTKAKHKVDDQ